MLPDLFERGFISATNGKDPPVQRPRTWLVSWKPRPNDPSENTSDGSFSARSCYMLHCMLVMIHIVLLILYIRHWEHRITLSFTPTNNNVLPVILSASLQAFYTIYTVVLLFLTQRLAISRTLVRRLKLTAIHDISGAWAGLGSALSSVWRQTDIPASWWMTSAVTAYLTSISVLHITSSTILQFQTFNVSMSTSVPTTLGWLDDLSYGSSVNWESVTASLPVVNQLSGLVTVGLSNTTIYDTAQKSSVVGNVTVNATTVTSRCGLLPNVTYSVNTSTATVQLIPGDKNSQIPMSVSPPWSDMIQILQEYADPVSGVLLMVSTLLEIEPSVQEEVAVNMTWESWFNNMSYVVPVYFVLCSLSANPTDGVVDIQSNSLLSPMPIWQPSAQWEMHQWTDQDYGPWQAEIGRALSIPVGSGNIFTDATGRHLEPSIADEYIMSLVGLNLTAEALQCGGGAPPLPNSVMRPDKLELAVAKAASQLIWIAGRIDTSNGLQPGNGTANVNEELIALRLNINLLPLSFAASASVIMLVLALRMTRAFCASRNSQAAIPNIGALQLLWLGHHSASVSEILEDVEHPTEANLRRAGMIEVCLAKTISDEEESGSSTESLSGEVDHSPDDEM
ncbi:uncharacterized protein EDB91DRAFT_1200164 [Suillus paluster]|uniref:uncharacterized protein n=1 Tax=Suillus paluster TaxID=48578 RepID=UPI001B87DE18|nr:uncharacterized protein EDB91DRAFT_1200164 [Suillus paluster]KAG1744598.1 hypothetical protein EDB91DRAFT_1200164 [Suillus paluster]